MYFIFAVSLVYIAYFSSNDCTDVFVSYWIEIRYLYPCFLGLNSFPFFQVECLRMDGVLQRRNLVYCASTRYFPVYLKFILNFLSYNPLLILVVPFLF